MTISIDERAAEIRSWTKPRNPVPLGLLARYAKVAARWEYERWQHYIGAPTPAEDERFAALTGVLREMLAQMGLAPDDTWEPTTPAGLSSGLNKFDVKGITRWRGGFLPCDPACFLTPVDWRIQAEIDWGKKNWGKKKKR